MKSMQKGSNSSHNKRAVFSFCCMCIICCMLFVSCISLPGEKEIEDRKLAAEYYELAQGYAGIKKYEKAIEWYEKAREKSSEQDKIKIDYQMARTYALGNKWDEACSLYLRLLETDPGNTNLKESYAYTLYKSGEKDKALQLYAELCEQYPGDERLSKNYEELVKESLPPEEESEETEEVTDDASEDDTEKTEGSEITEPSETIPEITA